MRVSHSSILEIRTRREDFNQHLPIFFQEVMFVVMGPWQTTAVRRRVDVKVDVKDTQGRRVTPCK